MRFSLLVSLLVPATLLVACPAAEKGTPHDTRAGPDADDSVASVDTGEPCLDPDTWYLDGDGDGYGLDASVVQACEQPEGHVTHGGDCDDQEPGVSPGADESCNGVDDDCDGSIDEDDAVDAATWYDDDDGDGYGDDADTHTSCTTQAGRVTVAGDCDDSDGSVYPGAPEVCGDGVLNDCEGDHAVAMSECGWGGSVNLSEADAKFTGSGEEMAGHAVVGAGDVDGDGLGDLLVGAPYRPAGGLAHLLMGGGALSPFSGTASLADADASFEGLEDGWAGRALSSAGDVDGDGLDDLAIADPKLDAGSVYLVLADGALGALSGTFDLSASDLVLEGEDDHGYAGRAVSGLGDADGDGLGDLLVGAPFVDDHRGEAYLALSSGSLAAPDDVASLEGVEAVFTLGSAEIGWIGYAVAGAGDVDGDGLADLLVGAPAVDGDDRAFLVLAGGASAPLSGALDLDDADAVFTGADGYALASAGDVDGDGLTDILLGDWLAANLVLADGALGPLEGELALDGADAILKAEYEDTLVYMTLACAGDVDADGFADLLLGVPGSDGGGAAYAVLAQGALSPLAGTQSLADADLRLTTETEAGDEGVAVGGAGDVDGDGFADILVGDEADDGGGHLAGAAWLVFGGGY